MRKIIQEDYKSIDIDILRARAFHLWNGEAAASSKLSEFFAKASDLFYRTAVPVCVVEDVTCAEFQLIYSGRGHNERKTPLSDLMTNEASYFLFAMTLGADACRHISDLFRQGDYLLGHFLDMICSEGIEIFADCITAKIYQKEVARGNLRQGDVVLRYSPGYCGWHVSGQQMLHEHLQSRDIGITLTETFYMEPIKSISGVMIGGRAFMHRFKNDYPFCDACHAKTCRKRLATVQSLK